MAKTQKIGKTVKIVNDDRKIIEADDIQSDKKVKSPFTKRNIILLILLLAVSITLVILTILLILKIDFSKLFESMSNGFKQQLGWMWFLLLLIFAVYSVFMHYATLWIRIRKWGFKISHWEYWLFATTIAFLKAVMPVLFSDPYTIFWLKTKGIPTSKCTSLMFSNTLLWQICQFAVSFPSFVMILIFRDKILVGWEGYLAFSCLCIGVIIDVFCIAIMTLMCFSKRTHYALSLIFNWFKKKLHMKYHTKSQIADKYKEKATIKRDVIEFFKDWKTTIVIFVVFVINELVLYFAVAWALYFIQHASYEGVTYVVGFNLGWAFNSAVAALKANRLNFILPGQEGSIEFLLKRFLLNFGGWQIDGPQPIPQPTQEALEQTVATNSILIWRSFNNYFPAVIGMGSMIGLTTQQIVSYKNKKKNKNEKH